MNSLNVQFLESYKRLDSYIKEIYELEENGVTEYINDMIEIENGSAFVYDWDSNLEQLKRLRHIRNRLCHEVGSFGENLCSESDIRWLDDFRESLINQNDPLSLYEKHLKTIKTNSVADFNRLLFKAPTFSGKAPQSPKTSKFSAKVLLFAALTVISFIVIFSLVLIYFLFYK